MHDWYAVAVAGMIAFGIVMIVMGIARCVEGDVSDDYPLDADLQPDKDIRENRGL